jgi:hypothetical protein
MAQATVDRADLTWDFYEEQTTIYGGYLSASEMMWNDHQSSVSRAEAFVETAEDDLAAAIEHCKVMGYAAAQ